MCKTLVNVSARDMEDNEDKGTDFALGPTNEVYCFHSGCKAQNNDWLHRCICLGKHNTVNSLMQSFVMSGSFNVENNSVHDKTLFLPTQMDHVPFFKALLNMVTTVSRVGPGWALWVSVVCMHASDNTVVYNTSDKSVVCLYRALYINVPCTGYTVEEEEEKEEEEKEEDDAPNLV